MSRDGRPEVVVVTGASAGIGRAVVREFAAHGAHVGLLARGADGLAGARREVEAAGGRALALPTDVADPGAVESAAAAVESELGPIDVWVNNAAASVFAPVKAMTAADYRRVTEVTYLGYVHGTLAALRRMLPRDRGTIVQVGSALSYRGVPLRSAYSAAKHAVEGFTESLRCELIHDGSHVRVTLVHPPATATPQHAWSKSRLARRVRPIPPVYRPEVAARAIHHAAHHYRREWTVGLLTSAALTGNAVLPGVGDWYLGRVGFESQLSDEPEDPDRPHNLWHPLPGDRGASDRSGDRAADRSPSWWVSKHRGPLLAAGLAVVGLAALAARGNAD